MWSLSFISPFLPSCLPWKKTVPPPQKSNPGHLYYHHESGLQCHHSARSSFFLSCLLLSPLLYFPLVAHSSTCPTLLAYWHFLELARLLDHLPLCTSYPWALVPCHGTVYVLLHANGDTISTSFVVLHTFFYISQLPISQGSPLVFYAYHRVYSTSFELGSKLYPIRL